jgi:hypothetical protein
MSLSDDGLSEAVVNARDNNRPTVDWSKQDQDNDWGFAKASSLWHYECAPSLMEGLSLKEVGRVIGLKRILEVYDGVCKIPAGSQTPEQLLEIIRMVVMDKDRTVSSVKNAYHD